MHQSWTFYLYRQLLCVLISVLKGWVFHVQKLFCDGKIISSRVKKPVLITKVSSLHFTICHWFLLSWTTSLNLSWFIYPPFLSLMGSGHLCIHMLYVVGGIWQRVVAMADVLLHGCSLHVCDHTGHEHRDYQGSVPYLRGFEQQSSVSLFSLQSGGKQVGQGWSFRMKTSQPR